MKTFLVFLIALLTTATAQTLPALSDSSPKHQAFVAEMLGDMGIVVEPCASSLDVSDVGQAVCGSYRANADDLFVPFWDMNMLEHSNYTPVSPWQRNRGLLKRQYVDANALEAIMVTYMIELGVVVIIAPDLSE